jgi:hypothetical protein
VLERKRWESTGREKGTSTWETQAGKGRKGTRRKDMTKQGESQEENEMKNCRKDRKRDKQRLEVRQGRGTNRKS